MRSSIDVGNIRCCEKVDMGKFSCNFPEPIGIIVCQIQAEVRSHNGLVELVDPAKVLKKIKNTVSFFRKNAKIHVFPELCFPKRSVGKFVSFLETLDTKDLIVIVGLEHTTFKEQLKLINGSENCNKEKLIDQLNAGNKSGSLFNSCLIYTKTNNTVNYFIHTKTKHSRDEMRAVAKTLFEGRELHFLYSNKLTLVPLICYDLLVKVKKETNIDRILKFRDEQRSICFDIH